MLDQRTLTSMKRIRTINQVFSLIATDHLNLLRKSINKAAHMRIIKKVRSNGLESGAANDDGNHLPKGRLEI